MKHIITSIFCLLSFSVFAQKEIKIAEAKNHVGDSVKICTKIFGGKYLENAKGTPTFLNAGGNYPYAPLTLVIWADTRKDFKNKPEEYYAGKDVCVTGKIELFRDKLQIEISNVEQIKEVK
jgi:hypothetical protein